MRARARARVTATTTRGFRGGTRRRLAHIPERCRRWLRVRGAVHAAAPRPPLHVAIVHGGARGAGRGPRPPARPVADPVAPEHLLTGEAVVPGGTADAVQHADRLPTEPEPVAQAE